MFGCFCDIFLLFALALVSFWYFISAAWLSINTMCNVNVSAELIRKPGTMMSVFTSIQYHLIYNERCKSNHF